MKSTRILHVISSVNPAHGGPIEGVKQLYRPLTEAGIEVEIACSDSDNDEWVLSSEIPVHALGPSKGSYAYAPKLLSWLKSNHQSYSAIIVEGIWQYHSFAAFRALSGTETPYFVFTHGMLDPWFKKTYPLKHLKKWLYWPWADYWVLRKAKGVFFTCEEERILARESFWLYQCTEKVVSYGIATPPPFDAEKVEVFLQKNPHLRGKKIVLFLGRLHEKKGCDILIEAFSRVANEDENLHLLMVGPDQVGLKSSLQKLAQDLDIADKITWLGLLTGDDKWTAFHAAHIFALPSHQENFGIVVAEALACGKPVLISNKVNVWREIEREQAGFVGDDTVDATAMSFKQWLALDSSDLEKLSVRARQCFLSCFEVGHTSKNLISVIKSHSKEVL